MFVVDLYLPALLVALVITVTEMTEVVAVVFALGTEASALGHGALGAVAGTATVGVLALASGAVLLALPRSDLLWGAAIVLFAFGIFLFRGTLRAFRRARAAPATPPGGPAGRNERAAYFAGGFAVGAVEATEAVIVLLALTAAGYGTSAIVGALVGGGALVLGALAVRAQIRRIKVLTLRWGATAMLFTFSVFWAGEAGGVPWPGQDLFLVVLFAVAIVVVRLAVEVALRARIPLQRNG